MKRFALVLAAAALMGCEGAVLVNNRPERTTPGIESPTPAEQTQQASDTTAADMDLDRAQTAGATTQPSSADQTVETTNTRIESQSN
jgi:hypothetical protein